MNSNTKTIILTVALVVCFISLVFIFKEINLKGNECLADPLGFTEAGLTKDKGVQYQCTCEIKSNYFNLEEINNSIEGVWE